VRYSSASTTTINQQQRNSAGFVAGTFFGLGREEKGNRMGVAFALYSAKEKKKKYPHQQSGLSGFVTPSLLLYQGDGRKRCVIVSVLSLLPCSAVLVFCSIQLDAPSTFCLFPLPRRLLYMPGHPFLFSFCSSFCSDTVRRGTPGQGAGETTGGNLRPPPRSITCEMSGDHESTLRKAEKDVGHLAFFFLVVLVFPTTVCSLAPLPLCLCVYL
jgi:hypothetical protein